MDLGFGSASALLSLQTLWFMGTVFVTLRLTVNETLTWLSSLPILLLESFWCWQGNFRHIYILSSPHCLVVHEIGQQCRPLLPLGWWFCGGQGQYRRQQRRGSKIQLTVRVYCGSLLTVWSTLQRSGPNCSGQLRSQPNNCTLSFLVSSYPCLCTCRSYI